MLGPILAFPAHGAMIDAVSPDIFVSAASYGAPANAIADGYGPDNAALRESWSFNANFLVVSADGREFSSLPTQFANVPYTTIGSSRYFVFVLDAQETGQNASLGIDSVRVTVDGKEVWRTTEAILLNGGAAANHTLTSLGNGADMALYVPVRVVDGLSLTGNSTFVFSAIHHRLWRDQGPHRSGPAI